MRNIFLLRNSIILCLLALLGIVMMTSCNKSLNREKLVEYINDPDNGVFKEKQVRNYNYQLKYRPSSFLINQELSGDTNVSQERLNEIANRYNQYYYFIYSISIEGQEVLGSHMAANRNKFGEMVNQLAFRMGNNVSIVTPSDTVYVADYIYPRLYGMGTSTNILFAFERKKIEKSKSFRFEMEDIGLGSGTLKFKFQTKDIRKTPELKVFQ